jgi:polysaccharide export outer membrane protein
MSRYARTLSVITVLLVLIGGTASFSYAQPAAPPATNARASSAPAPNAPPANGPLDEYRIGPEDVLDIVVWKTPELARTVQVRPDGRISLPLVNDLEAANMTPMELKAALTKGYKPFITEPEISVIVKEVHSVKVSVIGLVKTPGRFELRSRATVLDALALAGGFTDFAKRDRILIRRQDGTGVAFNYNKVLDDPDAKENIVLLPGDIIIVP